MALTGRIAFASTREGDWHLYVMAADGTGITRVAAASVPVWSPDGQAVTFVSPADGVIYAVDPDGSGLRRFSEANTSRAAPSWAPDGQRVAFVSYLEGSDGLFVGNVDGTGLTRLTPPALFCSPRGPSWSPDGSRLVFSGSEDSQRWDIFSIGADGSGLTQLPGPSGYSADPAWSPDGERIAFVSTTLEGHKAVHVMGPDGSEPSRLGSLAAQCAAPGWSPDGRHIVFAATEERIWNLYVTSVDGAELIRLTTTEAHDNSPAWAV